MTNLEQTINQAIADFDAIETAIEENGVDVPKGTDTKEYGNLINEAVSLKYNEGKESGIETGMTAEQRRFWELYQSEDGGKTRRSNYLYAFHRLAWRDEIYNPIYPIVFGNGNTDTSNVYSHSWITDTKVSIDATARTIINTTFHNALNLITIRELIVHKDLSFVETFYNCNELQNLKITGIIGQNGFNVQWSKKLTHDSLMSIINALEDKSEDTSGTEWKVTIGANNLSKLSTEEINIAINKGWFIE